MKNMKTFKLKLRSKLVILVSISMLVLGSCSLEEDTYSIYTPETFYSNDFQILSSLSGIYRNFAAITGMGVEYRTLELSADQVVVQAKIQGWWGGDAFWQLMEHNWNPDHSYISGTWNTFFRTVGQTNGLLTSLEDSNLEVSGPVAELKALRAYAYFFLMDLFGNVPIFTEPKVDPLNLPEQNTRTEVFEFVVSELKAAAEDLPSKSEAGGAYYGRLTKEAAWSLLATVYLNAEVYTGIAMDAEAEQYADMVINSGSYSLLPNYFDNFVPDNQNNAEFIFGAVYSPDVAGGIGHPLVQKVLPGISGGLFGLPYTPQNGFATRPSIYNAYEDQDVRKEMFLAYGPLKDPRNGEVVMVERVVPDNNSALYEPGVSTEGPVPYDIIPATGIRSQPMNAGIKWIKWLIDPNTQGGNAGNDIAFIRYADIILIKAEAMARQGNLDGALEYVNMIRERSNATKLTSLTLEDILEERNRELAFEMTRRRDLIRFGEFTKPWEWKEASEPYRTIYPIPQAAINSNPKLEQNPGY
ncbi:RagB/SusD family nutrient uptake outer membrane protein [Gramella sp. AN32]|uniref:RagB/SusD family nutrient uptake outer membrane protein n=1 Tax=Christiangramia antarctica TaxID=2058158 RepID=A0ABW5X4N4_9FLAO|nr:RagB/SusD family nutrient uptake outer membrane protein [Gramella sp. AN32]MCM4157238.1 RagB/SusD family nutrient uptake outer membrane protein [Gramella sp. AN32]